MSSCSRERGSDENLSNQVLYCSTASSGDNNNNNSWDVLVLIGPELCYVVLYSRENALQDFPSQEKRKEHLT